MDKETKKWLGILSILLALAVILTLLFVGGRINGIHFPASFEINLN